MQLYATHRSLILHLMTHFGLDIIAPGLLTPAPRSPLQQMEAAVVIVPEAVPVAHGAAGAQAAQAVIVHHNVHRAGAGFLTQLLVLQDNKSISDHLKSL